MLSVYSDDHRLHFGQSELVDGKLQPCFEMPSRADTVLARVKSQNLGEVIAPKDFGREPLLRIHDAAYLDFLQGAWARWTAEGHSGDLVSTTFPGRRLRATGRSHGADGRAGLLQLRHRGADHRRHLAGHLQLRPGRADRPGAYAPGRPQRLRSLPSAGPSRRWRLHGRLLLPQQCRHRHPGVPRPGRPARGDPRCRLSPWQRHQDIFYRRDDVLFASIHGDPRVEYPYFLGYADERGEGAGEGCNHNYPLAHGSGWDSGRRRSTTPACGSPATPRMPW